MGILSRIPQAHPFKFQLALASFKTWAADYIVQTTVEGREKIDWKRSAVCTFYPTFLFKSTS
jgi:hypothetical protein